VEKNFFFFPPLIRGDVPFLPSPWWRKISSFFPLPWWERIKERGRLVVLEPGDPLTLALSHQGRGD